MSIGIWMILLLTGGKSRPPKFEQVSPSLHVLQRVLTDSHCSEILTNACWSIFYLCSGSADNIQVVRGTGNICGRVVGLLRHHDEKVVSGALHAVQGIARSNYVYHKQAILDHNALSGLSYLLKTSNPSVQRSVCRVLANITNTSDNHQIQAVIDWNIFPLIIDLLHRDKIGKEALWVISNVTSFGTEEQIEYLVNKGCMPPLCELVFLGTGDIMALKAIDNILRLVTVIGQRQGTVNPQLEVGDARVQSFLCHRMKMLMLPCL